MIIKINFLDESIKIFKIMFKNKPQYFVFVFLFGSKKHLKDGFKGSGLLFARDCILVELKVMEVNLHYSATRTEASCSGKFPPDVRSSRERDSAERCYKFKTIWGPQALPEKEAT